MTVLLAVAASGHKHHWTVVGGVCLAVGAGLIAGAARSVGAWFQTSSIPEAKRHGYRVFSVVAAAVGVVLMTVGFVAG
jgi:hypothetical protein